jgi:hypothetical protein
VTLGDGFASYGLPVAGPANAMTLSSIDESPKIAWLCGHAESLGWPDVAAERLGEVIRIAPEVRAFGAVLPN